MTNTTNRLDLQAIFDKVSTHLIKQGFASINSGGCAYRGEHGRQCAIGCLIPDELYRRSMEGHGVTEVLKFTGVLELFSSDIGIHDLDDFLSALQNIHDFVSVDEWPLNLRDFAKIYDLSTAAMDQVLETEPPVNAMGLSDGEVYDG